MKNHDSQCAARRRLLFSCIHCACNWALKKAKPMPGSAGRVRSILLTPYSPGFPLLIPGERFNKTIVDYLKFASDFNEKFPGFETDVHGLVTREVDGKRGYFVDCVRK